MIRRFETYAFLPATTAVDEGRLATVLADADRYIPEVLHCGVGWNRSEAPARLIWEHAFASAESYQHYMVHPYHVEMIDRHVLADSPERTVEPAKGAGLFGYHCEDIYPVSSCTGRRVVLLDIDPEADDDAVAAVFRKLAADATTQGASATAGGANALATTWFDGVSQLPLPAPKWNYIWEAGYSSLPDQDGTTPAAFGPVRRTRELRYELVNPPSEN